MSRQHIRRAIVSAAVVAVLLSAATVDAGDCFRRLGIGFSAGYNAPLPCAPSTGAPSFGNWAGWKGACIQTSRPAPSRCGCETPAPCGAPSSAPCGDCGCGVPFAPFMGPMGSNGMLPRIPAPIY